MTVTAAAVQLTTALTLLLTLLVLAQDGNHLEVATDNLVELATDQGNSINAYSQDQLRSHDRLCPQTRKCIKKDGTCQSSRHECEGKKVTGCKRKCSCCVPIHNICPQRKTCTSKGGKCQAKKAICKGETSMSCKKGCICCKPTPCRQRKKCTKKRGKCQRKNAVCPGKKSKGCARGCICCEPESDVCKLPFDVGTCKKMKPKMKPKFYFDIATGKCKNFTYEGCEENPNTFDTYDNCMGMCIKDACLLPSKTGPCKAKHPRFYFNDEARECEMFIYGGCRGNANNFMTKQNCINTCIKGVGCNQLADRKTQKMLNKVKKYVEDYLDRKLEDFTVESYKTVGTNYFAEVRISSSEYIYIRVHKELSGSLTLHGVHTNIQMDGYYRHLIITGDDPKIRPGGVGPELCADEKTQKLIEMVKSKVQMKLKDLKMKMKRFRVVSYATQVVSGMYNAYAKVLIGPRKYIHIRVYKDLSGTLNLGMMEVNKTLSDPID